MKNEQETTYSIKLHCHNCFTNFNKKFPMGFEALEKGSIGESSYILEPGEKYEYVKCPNCGCTNVSKVRKI